ncbi:hypothetical protein ACGF0K_36940 [Streptomyces sp. NPDC048156]|uniref:hypothetical protein n=1 Tax=Streptomyces sp. NPDC048156 TaxID=3365502 RepID=UPI0037231D9F
MEMKEEPRRDTVSAGLLWLLTATLTATSADGCGGGEKGVGGWNWTRNKRFIDDALKDGGSIRIVNDPTVPLYKRGNVFQRELKYLKDKGYGWREDGEYWEVYRVRP